MTTSKKSSSSATRKSAYGDAAQDIQDTVTKPFRGIADRLQSLNLMGAASTLLDGGRKDLQALVQVNEKSYQGLQAVVQRQAEMLRASIGEWQEAVRGMAGGDPKENLARLDELGRSAFKRALDDMRELAELAAKSQGDAFNVVRERISDSVEQAGKLLQQPRDK